MPYLAPWQNFARPAPAQLPAVSYLEKDAGVICLSETVHNFPSTHSCHLKGKPVSPSPVQL